MIRFIPMSITTCHLLDHLTLNLSIYFCFVVTYDTRYCISEARTIKSQQITISILCTISQGQLNSQQQKTNMINKYWQTEMNWTALCSLSLTKCNDKLHPYRLLNDAIQHKFDILRSQYTVWFWEFVITGNSL